MEHIPAKTVAIASAAQAQNMASKCLKVPGVKLINQRTVGELFFICSLRAGCDQFTTGQCISPFRIFIFLFLPQLNTKLR